MDSAPISPKEEYEALAERQVDSAEVFSGHLLHVFRDGVTLPDGKPACRELIRHPGAVAVVPLDADGNVYLERQFRYPVGEVITEIPAGKLNAKTEDRLEAAKRELREETGLTAEKWIFLGDFYPSPAYTDEVIALYLATGLRAGDREPDEDEFLDVFRMPLGKAVDDVLAGRVPDSKTQAALLRAAAMTGYFRRENG